MVSHSQMLGLKGQINVVPGRILGVAAAVDALPLAIVAKNRDTSREIAPPHFQPLALREHRMMVGMSL
jgi:hypothetical protein